MPPRFVYWTIIAGGMPTAFRAAQREELLPTFQRIRDKHPDAEMKYFAHGKLWASDEEARAARNQGDKRDGSGPSERRTRDWRPGGNHRDPRQPFNDQKQARNQRWRKERFDRRQQLPREKPHGDPLRQPAAEGKRPGRPRREWEQRSPGGASTSRESWRDRPPQQKPHGDRFRKEARGEWRGNAKPDAPRRPWPGDKRWGQDREDRPHRGPRPDREPRRGDEDPKQPPRPSEPRIEPPGPPERGSRPGRGKRPFVKRDSGRPRGGGKPPRGRR